MGKRGYALCRRGGFALQDLVTPIALLAFLSCIAGYFYNRRLDTENTARDTRAAEILKEIAACERSGAEVEKAEAQKAEGKVEKRSPHEVTAVAGRTGQPKKTSRPTVNEQQASARPERKFEAVDSETIDDRGESKPAAEETAASPNKPQRQMTASARKPAAQKSRGQAPSSQVARKRSAGSAVASVRKAADRQERRWEALLADMQ